MDSQTLFNAVQESFRYFAPSWIDMDRIIDFVEWGENYKPKPEEIEPIIEQLLEERFIVDCPPGWQIISASSERHRNKDT